MAWWAKGIVRGQLGVGARKQRARREGEEYGVGRGGATHFMTIYPAWGEEDKCGEMRGNRPKRQGAITCIRLAQPRYRALHLCLVLTPHRRSGRGTPALSDSTQLCRKDEMME